MANAGFSPAEKTPEHSGFLGRPELQPGLAQCLQNVPGNGTRIAKVTPQQVKAGEISPLFRQMPAVILCQDERIGRMVGATFDWLGLDHADTVDGRSYFSGSLVDLARNHLQDNMKVGDMLRFVPKLFGHVARKFLIYKGADGNSLEVWPSAFHVGDWLIPVPSEIVESAWNIMSEVLVSALAERARSFTYGVQFDVLVYPSSSSVVRSINALLADATLLGDSTSAAGLWTRLGHRIDASKDSANGLFNKKIVRDLFAVACQVPKVGTLLAAINERMDKAGWGVTPEGYGVIAPAHVDGTKYITALMGRRDNVETEYLWNDRWLPLPVSDDAIALFPSARISSISDIQATNHRVLLHDPSAGESASSRNITVTMAIVDLPANLPRH